MAMIRPVNIVHVIRFSFQTSTQ